MTEEEQKVSTLDERKFNKIRIQCIETIYGDRGKEMVSLLGKNPLRAIPIIYDRLNTRQQTLKQTKADMLQSWKAEQEINFYKSIDHKSFSFKLYEKKNSNSKAFMNDLKNHSNSYQKHKNDNILKGGSRDC